MLNAADTDAAVANALAWNLGIVDQELAEATMSTSSSMGGLLTTPASQLPPLELGAPLVVGPGPGARCEAAVIWLHGLSDQPETWTTMLGCTRTAASASVKWVPTRPKNFHALLSREADAILGEDV
jgi:hypothetical protein